MILDQFLSRLFSVEQWKDWLLKIISCHLYHATSCWINMDLNAQISTTAALIDVTHTVVTMLETSSCVRCLLIDFSKAFDSVNHLKLVNKLKQYGLSHSIITWIVSFSTDKSQYTNVGGNLWRLQFINRSIVQGSGIGPCLFIIMIFNLKARAATNHRAVCRRCHVTDTRINKSEYRGRVPMCAKVGLR